MILEKKEKPKEAGYYFAKNKDNDYFEIVEVIISVDGPLPVNRTDSTLLSTRKYEVCHHKFNEYDLFLGPISPSIFLALLPKAEKNDKKT